MPFHIYCYFVTLHQILICVTLTLYLLQMQFDHNFELKLPCVQCKYLKYWVKCILQLHFWYQDDIDWQKSVKGLTQIGHVCGEQKEGKKFVQFYIRMVFQPVFPKLIIFSFPFKTVSIMLKFLIWLHSYDTIPKQHTNVSLNKLQKKSVRQMYIFPS